MAGEMARAIMRAADRIDRERHAIEAMQALDATAELARIRDAAFDAFAAELADLRAQIAALRIEVAQLRAERAAD